MTNSETRLEVTRLQKEIKQQVALLKRYHRFVCYILDKIGERTKHEEKRFHTSSKLELRDFHGFDFYGHYGHTEMGGNNISIHYHGIPFLRLAWQFQKFNPPKDGKVEFIHSEQNWWDPLEGLIKNRKEYIAKFQAARAQSSPTQREIKLRKRLEDLRAIAKGIAVPG